MFASNMKILTLNTNDVSPTVQGGGVTQSIVKELRNSGNDDIENDSVCSATSSGSNHKSHNKREQKHVKTKFIQSQKYHHQHKNNNNNGNKLKNQHYNNNNSNSTSSLSRKKYYQQQQHHHQQHQYQQQQQQKCLTSMQQNNMPTQTSKQINNNNNNNNNSNLVKNQNYTNVDLIKQDPQQQQRRQYQHTHPHNIPNAVNNLVNHHNTQLMETCTCLLQQSNCDKLSLSSCSSGSSSSTASSLPTPTGDHHHHRQHQQQQQQLDAICYNNQLKCSLSSNSKTSRSNAAQTTASTATACISCWADLTKLPQKKQSPTSSNFKSPNTPGNLQEFVASALAAAAAQANKSNSNLNFKRTTSTSSTTSSTTTLTSSGGQLHLSSNTNTSFAVSKKKSFWKNSNTSRGGGAGIEGGGGGGGAGAGGNRSLLSSGYLLGNTNQLKEKQYHVSDKNLITNASRKLGKNTNGNSNVQKYSTTLTANVSTTPQKQISKHQVPAGEKMTTTLSTSSGSTSVKTTVSSNNNTASASSSKTCTLSPKQQQDTLENHNDSRQMLKALSNNTNSNSDINKTPKTSSSTSTPTSPLPSSPNSYTLDFLHSVGVKMTGVALRSSGIQGSSNAYGSQSTTSSPAQSNYPYTTGVTTNQRQPRYMYGGSGTNNANSGSQQQQHYHHHHQPSQLTIASFLHKDLLGGDHVLSNVNSTSSSRGASSSSSNTRTTNNYNDPQQQHYAPQQPPNHTRYHHNYYATPYQQQSTVMQHTNYGSGGGYGGELARLVTNGSSGGQRNSAYAYTNYHGASGEGVVGKSSAMAQRQLQNNVNYYKNSVNSSQANKKSYASSTTSTCSSSSLKSISSNSSNISSRQLQTAVAAQDSNNISSSLNLAIETLPSKTLSGGNQRGNHRGHHHNHHSQHHNHHGHHHGNHHHQHSIMNSPNILQHQNYYNLTYVTTDGSASGPTSRGCSPAPPSLPPTPLSATNCKSPKSLESSPNHVAMLMNFNATHLQYPRYAHTQQQLAAQQQQQFHQFQQQQENFLNKKILIPLTLNMPSPSPSPTPPPNTTSISLNTQQTPPSPHNIICCSQLDEATTLAAAAAATSSSSGIIAGNDYDSDASSNHSSTQIKYRSLKAVKSTVSSSSSSSSSSSAFITSITGQQGHQPNCNQPTTPAACGPTTLLHSPLDYNYSAVATQAFPNQQVTQQTQLPQFYGNSSGAVISLLNLPTKTPNGYTDEDYQQSQQQQQQQQHQFHFNTTVSQRSAEHLNISSALSSSVSNRSNNNSNYWSPSYHNNQFLYHQTSSTQVALMPPTTSSSSSCGSSSASISPRLPNDDIQPQTQQRMHNSGSIASNTLSSSPCSSCINDQFNNIMIGNSSNSDSGMLLTGSSCSSNSSSVSGCSNNGSGFSINSSNGGHTYKRGSSQLLVQQQQRLIAQQTYQSSSSSTSSLSSSSASTLTSAVRARGGGGGECGFNTNSGRNNQFPLLPQTAITSTVASSGVSGVQQLTPTPTQHLYSLHQQQQHQSLPPPLPPHNLLYNNPQTHHMRALSSSSISSSVHDFFTHTPPDRFLARAHLIEAKEAPATLLNNSKWDLLSQGIWKKFINSQQTEETFKQKMHLWRYLYLFIKNAYPRYGLYLVGSTISGFGADSSDVDMCLVSRSASSIDPRMEALFNLTVLRDCLSKSGEFENFNLIEAKVPILRFCDRMHQLEVDLNFNNCVGIKNTHLLYCYSQLDWRLRPLVLVTKLWAQYHNINNAKNMTISSYSLVLMVIHFLQYAVNPPVLPCLHDIFPDKFPLLRSNDFGYVDMNETIGPYDSKNTQTIGELFLLFLEYYSCFDYTQFAISVRTGGLLPVNVCRIAKSLKNDIHQWKELCIEEPFDLTNTARSVYDYETFERVKAVFMASWRILKETLDLNSIFSTIIIPSPPITENTAEIENISPITSNKAFSQIVSDVDVDDIKINFEQYVKDFSNATTAMENYEENNNKSSIEQNDEESFINVDSDITDEGNDSVTAANSSFVATSTSATNNRKTSKHNDLNRTLTPRQVKVFAEKEYPLSPSTSTSCIKTSTKNVNRNNNNNNNSKTATTMIS